MQDSLSPNHSHIPGYGGFIPKDRAESLHAKTFTNKTKEAFVDYTKGNRNGLATTGFNITQDALVDHSKVASSHKYGKTELQTPHPGWIVLFKLRSQKTGLVLPRPPTYIQIRMAIPSSGKQTNTCRLKRSKQRLVDISRTGPTGTGKGGSLIPC
jgi:hypothetical protein